MIGVRELRAAAVWHGKLPMIMRCVFAIIWTVASFLVINSGRKVCAQVEPERVCKVLMQHSGRLVLPVESVGTEILGELDTGTTSFVLHSVDDDTRVAGLRISKHPVIRYGRNSVVTSYHDFPIRMFSRERQLVKVHLEDRSSFEEAFGVPKDAVIGMACISSQSLQINIRSAILRPTAVFPGDESKATKIEWNLKCPWIAVSLPLLGMRSVILDTGNDAWLSLNSNRIEQLVRAGHAAFLQERPMWTPGGVTSIKLYAVRYVDVSGVRFHNVPVVASHVEAIGLGLLQHFDMTLDFPNSRASFVPLEIARDQMPLDASGLRVVFRESDRLVVRRIVPDSPAEKAGFKEGDRILNFAGREPATLWRHEIDETLAKAGETIQLRIERDGKPFEIDLPLSRPFQYPPEWPPERPEFNPDAVPEGSGTN